eukprot:CAMPEP_0113538618 /NCGR_PEP_ID=MMETSP0015_2-20120614/7467_1 /TAXON_ID=2838 /ORGANISM="Odontella" /LENGTH=415 /DNA_ID=CAMNT_0000438215 /DNA_START=12 /DNA_END=1259 /DNA_ORIENTATION=- /assembly_acc=CAM_ASM_000160
MSILPTISAAPVLEQSPSVSSARRRPAATSAVRLAASFVLLASSAFLLLSSDSDTLSSGSASGSGRYLGGRDPLLTNLADLSGTKSAAETIERAKNPPSAGAGAGDEGAKAEGGEESEEHAAETVTPLYWHIYKAGGTSVKSVLTFCLDLTVASNFGVMKGHDLDTEIGVMQAGGHSYVNVDTISWPGIDRAAELGLAESSLADVVVSPPIHNAVNKIFSPSHRAMLFTVFRHPIDRLVSQYYYLQEASWESTYNPDIAKETLGEYAKKYNNRLTRQFVGKDVPMKPLTESDLELAKEVVRTRMIVGLMTDVEGAVHRFVKYFGWERPDGDADRYDACMIEQFNPKEKEHGVAMDGNRHKHPKLEKGTAEWEEVAKENDYDLSLYRYIVEVYEEQGRTMFKEDKKSLGETAATVS